MSTQDAEASASADAATETSPLLPTAEVNDTSRDNRTRTLCKLFLIASLYFLHRGMYDQFTSVYIILQQDINEQWPPSFRQYVDTLRVLLSLFTIGSWSHVADVWGRKPVMLISMIGTTISHLVFVQAEFIRKDFCVYVGSVALDCLFAGSIAFNGLLHTYIADCASPGSRFKLFNALKGLSMLFYFGGAELTMLPLILPAHWKYFTLLMIISSLAAVLNVVLIIWLLPETLRSPAHNLPILKAVISPATDILRTTMLEIFNQLTENFGVVKMWFGIIFSGGTFSWYFIFPYAASALALLLLYPTIAILYQRKPRSIQSVLRFTRHLAYTCLSLDVFSTVAVVSIAASNRIAHLVFDAISPSTVAIAPAIYSSVPSHSAVLFGSFSVIEALGGMFSSMFILRFFDHSDVTQYRLLYGALAICLILTGLLFFVDSTGGSVDEDDRSTVLSTYDDEETVTVYS
ncbi:uncharacterized protein ARMOST_19119 [Armillaria ostoyae]|uniref:Major facilitator superfamily (MFS) profile domain-containing protein n=1 Tax=Armillaria ostoyae TaxID=47428 RepID=A0A284S3R9_ARMOS|nr:uncharacterized protein ARMOST_19119 [Armillaria ostoyae]